MESKWLVVDLDDLDVKGAFHSPLNADGFATRLNSDLFKDGTLVNGHVHEVVSPKELKLLHKDPTFHWTAFLGRVKVEANRLHQENDNDQSAAEH